jgi:xanthine dehydrogenase accessory factor
MRYLLDSIIKSLEQGQPAVLGTIVASSGSAPRTSGARMLTLADGSLAGTVGGGVVEGACQAESRKMLENGELYSEFQFQLTAEEAAESGMVCGGAVRVLLNRISPAELDLFASLRTAYRHGERPILVTLLPYGNTPPSLAMVGQEGTTIPASIMNQAAAYNKRIAAVITDGRHCAFIEPLVPPGTVHIAGAGHVGLAVADLADYVGFNCIVIDDRNDFADPGRFPKAKEVRVISHFTDCLQGLGPEDYVVIVTRGHQFDRDVLAQALKTQAGYIGMIGSSKKRQAVYDSLLETGFNEEDLKRIYSPIGLDIGSDTPQEIGLSIVAELVKVRAEKL